MRVALSLVVALAIGATLTVTTRQPKPVRRPAPVLRPPPPTDRSILLIWLDDVAAMELALYGGPVSMPNLEALADQGVTFTAFYANGVCAPSRRSAMTGKWWIAGNGPACTDTLDANTPPASDIWIPEALSAHSSALIGKWHLGAAPSGAAWETAPAEHGFDYTVQMGSANVGACGGSSYSDWLSTSLGAEAALVSTYQPHAVRDAFVSGWPQVPFPRLAVVSANLAHTPIHVVPPPHEKAPGPLVTQRAKWEAMLVAYDDLIGDMVAAVDMDRCLVVVVGDNGTYGNVAPPGQGARAKGTVFERGVRVPCVMAGAGIDNPGRTAADLTHVVDLWPTLIDWAGGTIPNVDVDGVSLSSVLLDETHEPFHETLLIGCNWGVAGGEVGVVTLTRKLRQIDDDGDEDIDFEELYDLSLDPTELVDVSTNPAYATDLAALRAFASSESP